MPQGEGVAGTALHTKSLIVLQTLLFGKISITKLSCLGQCGVQRGKPKKTWTEE